MLINHLDKLNILKRTSSHIVCQCPVCGGDNLKISISKRAYGAYKCWSSFCSSKEIRQVLNIKSDPIFRPFVFRKDREPALSIQVPAKQFPESIQLLPSSSDTLFFERVSSQEVLYYYGTEERIKRIDLPDKKLVFPQELVQGVWTNQKTKEYWSLYRESSFPDCSFLDNAAIVWVEGEKTAEALCQFGVLATTASNSDWREPPLKLAMLRLAAKHIDAVVYIPDNDAPGIKKAELVEHCASVMDVACLVVPMTHFWAEAPPAGDFADLLERNYSLQDFLHDLGFFVSASICNHAF